ncbi:MAG: hypothetical protein FWF07_01195 [Methanomassiliicoccaceae archaeon]|nr:hypothetical protein [Methanomassiliicoccaceae archaeon]
MDGIIKKGRAAAFTNAYATNVLLNETDSDVRIYAFNEIIDLGAERIAISEGSIIMTDQATVLLYEQLKELIEKWKTEGKQVEVSAQRREMLEKMKDKK